jgi:putative DNA primase/helicase
MPRDLTALRNATVGKWRSLLPMLGVAEQYLTGKHSACPICREGKDRFRFTDLSGLGGWICNKCGHGDGFDLAMKVTGKTFLEIAKDVQAHLPGATFERPQASATVPTSDRAWQLYRSAERLNGTDPASYWLQRRGIAIEPMSVRFVSRLKYQDGKDGPRSYHPAMVSLFVGPDGKQATTHTTYLTPFGEKAPVESVRKLSPGPVPKGGAVRLGYSAETLGIAEGIETALAASQLFDLPVWAALNSGNLIKWQPPATVKNVVIFGDTDESMGGQHAAYALAYRLKSERSDLTVTVELPDQMGDDWNSYLMREASIQAAAE